MFQHARTVFLAPMDPRLCGDDNRANRTIVTTAPNDEQARELLKLMGFPFAEK